MKLDIDPRLSIGGGMPALITRLYELLRLVAQANNKRADGYTLSRVSASATYTMQSGDSVVLMDATGGARTVTLLAPSEADGKAVIVRKTDAGANTVTLQPPTGLIDGAATLVLTAAAPRAHLVSNGTNYFTV